VDVHQHVNNKAFISEHHKPAMDYIISNPCLDIIIIITRTDESKAPITFTEKNMPGNSLQVKFT